MEKTVLTVTENVPVAKDVYKMRLSGAAGETEPGQFINIAVPGRFLRRPISVHDACADGITIIYKVIGGGTEDMSRMEKGTRLDVLTCLGNGFDTAPSSASTVYAYSSGENPPTFAITGL